MLQPDHQSGICHRADQLEEGNQFSALARDIFQVKQALLGPDPAGELEALKLSGALERAVPEFAATWGERGIHDPRWHPEGDVWTHTKLVLQALNDNPDPALRYAAAFHDVGKPVTMERWPDGISNKGHEIASAVLFERLIAPRLGLARDLTAAATELIYNHTVMHHIHKCGDVSDVALIRLLARPDILNLAELQHADVMGTGLPLLERHRLSKRPLILALLGLPAPAALAYRNAFATQAP